MYRIIFFTLFIFFNISGFSQTINGRVVDESNKPIMDVNIYQPDTKKGTITNSNGVFSLELEKDKTQVFIQCIGFKIQVLKVSNIDFSKTLNIVLEQEVVVLPEFKKIASGEDPAYYIMRKAIAMAPYYNSQVSKYDCKVYIKGSFMITHIPWLMKKMIGKDEMKNVKIGKAYVSEAVSNVHYEYPNKTTQKLVAIRSSEADSQLSNLPAATGSLYNTSSYDMTSPLGPKSFSTYKYKLMGSFKEKGETINKIKVIPKNGRKKGVFTGFIYIIDNRWNVHSADLSMQMPMVKTNMKQIYGSVEDGVWMVKSTAFKVEGKAFGATGKGSYTASISDYKIEKNPNIDHSILAKMNGDVAEVDELIASEKKNRKVNSERTVSKTQKKIDKLLDKADMSNSDMRRLNRLIRKETVRKEGPKPLEVKPLPKISKVKIKNDSVFWAELRPVKLTKEEDESFVDKDSIVKIIDTPEYRDSIRNKQRKFELSHILSGKTYSYKKDSTRFSSSLNTSGLLTITNISFNTVDGFNMDFPFKYTLRDTMGKIFTAFTKFNYAYERKVLSFNSSLSYLFDGRTLSSINIGAAKYSTDFKGTNASSSMENLYYSIYAEKNFMKFYESRDAYVSFNREISNGLKFSAKFKYQNRLPLENNSSFKIFDIKGRSYTDNIIDNKDVQDWQYKQSEQHSFALQLDYTPRQFYTYRGNIKHYLGSDYPSFSLAYKKAFTKFGGDADFDYLRLGIKQSLYVQSNYLQYDFKAGKYLTSKKLYAQDLKYFRSNKEHLSLSDNFTRFRSLSYYEPISADYFIEAHVKYSMNRFLLKRLPFFNDKLLLKESLFVSYLNTERLKHYFEIGYGINNIFALLDAEFVAGFKKGKMDYLGFKFNIKLK
ncbi:MAG: DUF5686 family protein [Marinifilaceae bacterium]